MESTIKSPSQTCPNTITVRRNPPRSARAFPSTIAGSVPPHASYSIPRKRRDIIAPFCLEEIIDDDVPRGVPPRTTDAPKLPVEEEDGISSEEDMRVFLRIRPLEIISKPTSKKNGKNAIRKGPGSLKKETVAKNDNAKLKKKNNEICLVVKNSRSVTLSPPASLLQESSKRSTKTVEYDGFTQVFAPGSHQEEVYEKVMEPLVSDFLRGKSVMLAAMGPSGSGKTHTIFGCPREPGIVPLTLRRLFDHTERERNSSEEFSRTYYISVFEIYSEQGKGEKIFDLTSDGADLCLQQSAIKDLQEIMVADVSEAECVIARAMLKRATAMTNANSQSSRSQCIINIRSFLKKIDDGETEAHAKNAVLTVVDLAGAERERRTGNQGARLVESSFINNTSMVLGLCLRSLLEHQKNPKKPLQKHFQNSLLTRYLRDYFEGKKKMTLILTAKPGEDDYLETSYLLRQASPYMKIKFNDVEEPSNLLSQKRHAQTLPKKEQPKRKKFRDRDASVVDDGEGAGDSQSILQKEVVIGKLQEPEHLKVSGASMTTLKMECNECNLLKEKFCIELAKRDRNDQIMRNFSKALWDVLKQYKEKLEVSENAVHNLTECLQKEKFQNSVLEKELKDLKSCHSWCRQNSTETSILKLHVDMGFDTTGCLQLEQHELNNIHEKNNGEYSEELEHLEVKDNCSIADLTVTGLCDSESMLGNAQSQALVGNDDSSPMKWKELFSEEEKKNNGEYSEEREHLEVKDSCSNADVTGSGLCDSESMLGAAQSQALVGNDDSLPMERKELFSEEEKKNNGEYSEERDHLEVKDSCSNADVTGTGLSDSESMLGTAQSQALVGNDDSLPMERKELFSEEEKIPNGEVKHRFSNKSSVGEKPKRRLGPPPSLLLKQISNLDLQDDDKPKGSRGGRKSMAGERALTQGSSSLLKLLGNYRHL